MKLFKLLSVACLGLCMFVGAQAQSAVSVKDTKQDKKKSTVQRGAMTYDQVVEKFEHFPKVQSTGDAKADSEKHRKAMMEWKAKYPKEYQEFVKKMKDNTALSPEGMTK